MKKMTVCLLIFVFFTCSVGMAIAAKSGASGPAPNSRDGVSDGSGMDSSDGKSASAESTSNDSQGPAPNSGDGVSDGSGF